MDCWICGATADSREHLVKASDLRQFFGPITPESPVFYHSLANRNIALKSAKTNRVKSGKVLCRRCNDTRTAPFDRSWERLLEHLSNNWDVVKKSGRYKLQKVFPGTVQANCKNIHLYFVKLFGCRIVDDRIPIPIDLFSAAIRDSMTHPFVFLTFNYRHIPSKTGHYAGVSEVHAKQSHGAVSMATWYYSLGELDIQVTWFRDEPVRNVRNAWHPDFGSKIIKFRSR